MKKSILVFLGVFALTFNSKAQDGFEGILLAEGTDANKLMEAYFTPAMEGFIYGMNNGWYHTAKVHKTFGFDLTVGINASMVPSEKELFNISALGLTSVTSNSTSSTASTFAGPDTETSFTTTRTFNVNGNPEEFSADFNMPGGVTGDLPLNAVPAPIAQLNVGLPFKMEAMVRLLPETNLGDDGGKISMLGLGLKKEITNWFGPLDKLPLHVSLLAAYTKMNVSYGIEDQSFPSDPNESGLEIKNALANFDLKAFTVQAIASLNFPIINIYGGLGYSSGSSNFNMDGTYRGRFSYTDSNSQQTFTETIDLNAPDLKFDAGGFRTTVGARLSLGFFKVFAAYTLQEYNTVSAGVAISIR